MRFVKHFFWKLRVVVMVCGTWAQGVSAESGSVIPGSVEEVARFRKPPTESREVVDGTLWIEAEDFAEYGPWRLDTQFVHKMGSAYLIAAGVARPVGSAVTEVKIPEAGTWRVWVRTRNWLKDFAPGKFTVSIGGQDSGKVLGKGKPEVWAWESAGDFKLPAGPASLELIDLSGAFARCDALLLTRDMAYVPPDGLEECERERARLSGLPQEVVEHGEYDVVVIGAGSAGLPAAVAAARNGARTALVHDRPVLGGNASSELGVNIVGAGFDHPNAREGGLIEEAGLLRARYGTPRKHGFPKMSEAFHRQAAGVENLIIFNNQRVMGVEMDGEGVIGAVKAVDTLTLERSRVRGKLFIDCTGDGWVGYYAGAEYRFGREARSEFNEKSAPEQADEITMSGLVMGDLAISFRSKDQGHAVEYAPPEWAVELPAELGRNPRVFNGGEWWLEHPGTFNDLDEPERARDELLRITFAYWGFLKNDWSQKENARNYALMYVPHMDARRETRRLVGDYLFKEQDARTGRIFPDRISYGGWPLDLHHPLGIQSGKEGPYDKIPDPSVPIYSIPYRSTYSVNITNLFIAGRCMSCTHMGLGTLRVQGTLATVGQSVGTAAALCIDHGVMPRELGRQFIGELQQELLKDDQYIPELLNEDPDDLARTAAATASSSALVQAAGETKLLGSHPLDTFRAVMVPRGSAEHLEKVSLFLVSKKETPVDIQLHVRGAYDLGRFLPSRDIAVATATVPPKSRSYVSFDVKSLHHRPDVQFNEKCALRHPYIWFWLPKTPGVEWALMETGATDVFRAYRTGKGWQAVGGEQYAFFSEPALPGKGAGFDPDNVIDGVSRPVGPESHMWKSDPAQSMPQWLELDFGKELEMNTVQLTFDTDLNRRYPERPASRFCVKDYRVEVLDKVGEWKEVVAVRDNFLRHRIHTFPSVGTSKMRITVDATHGDPSARIFEVRAYHE